MDSFPSWDLTSMQVRPDLGGMISLHVISFAGLSRLYRIAYLV